MENTEQMEGVSSETNLFSSDVEEVKNALKEGVDPSAENNEGLYYHLNLINSAIRLASRYGHLEIVKLLMSDSRVDPSAENNEGLCYHLNLINSAIRLASRYGHLEIVKLLLSDNRVDPSANSNE